MSTKMHIRLDPVGGIAGDMFAAAVLDAWPELETDLVAALDAAGILRLASVARRDHVDHALTGSRFEVIEVADRGPEKHGHRHYRDIRKWLRSADLADRVRERALDIFDHLAGAEAKVHGVAPEDVSFHEVGNWDSIADVVAAAWLIEKLAGATWSCGPLPLGRGRVATAHGSLPVPAPATARLLEGMPTFQDGYEGERVTPTGAAIVRHLDPNFGPEPGVLRLERSGTGFGTAVFSGLSNTLRLLAFERLGVGGDEEGAESVGKVDRVAVCSFEIDDQTGEDLAVALDRVRSTAGVLDVTQLPVFGKKGRMAVRVQVLSKPDALRQTLETCFRETATLGIRWQTVERTVLEREQLAVQVGDRSVEIKRARRPGDLITGKAGMEDVATAEGGLSGREALRREAEATAQEKKHEG